MFCLQSFGKRLVFCFGFEFQTQTVFVLKVIKRVFRPFLDMSYILFNPIFKCLKGINI